MLWKRFFPLPSQRSCKYLQGTRFVQYDLPRKLAQGWKKYCHSSAWRLLPRQCFERFVQSGPVWGQFQSWLKIVFLMFFFQEIYDHCCAEISRADDGSVSINMTVQDISGNQKSIKRDLTDLKRFYERCKTSRRRSKFISKLWITSRMRCSSECSLARRMPKISSRIWEIWRQSVSSR